MQINIRPITTSDLSDFWQLAFGGQDAEWRQWNGPYFHDELPSQAAFMANADQWVNQPFRWLVTADDTMVGMGICLLRRRCATTMAGCGNHHLSRSSLGATHWPAGINSVD